MAKKQGKIEIFQYFDIFRQQKPWYLWFSILNVVREFQKGLKFLNDDNSTLKMVKIGKKGPKMEKKTRKKRENTMCVKTHDER